MLANVAQYELEARTGGLFDSLLHAVANISLHEANNEFPQHHISEKIFGWMVFRKKKDESVDDLMNGSIVGEVKIITRKMPLIAIKTLLMLIQGMTNVLYKLLRQSQRQALCGPLARGFGKIDTHQFVCWQYHTLTWKKIETGLIPQMHDFLSHDHTGQCRF